MRKSDGHPCPCGGHLTEAAKKGQTGRELTAVQKATRSTPPTSRAAAARKVLPMSEDERQEVQTKATQSSRKAWLRKIIHGEEQHQASMNRASREITAAVKRASPKGNPKKPIPNTRGNIAGIRAVADIEFNVANTTAMAQTRKDVTTSIQGGGVSFVRGVEPLVPPEELQEWEVTRYLSGARRGVLAKGFDIPGVPPPGWTKIADEAFRFINSPSGIGRTLSERVWNQTTNNKARVMGIVAQGMESGRSAGAIAKDLEGFLSRTNKSGSGIYSKAANNYIRIARTENTRAYQRAYVNTAKGSRWAKEIQWHLSASHRVPCVCETEIVVGGRDGKGIYPVGNVPPIPHPHCLCYWTTIIPDELFQEE